MDYNERLRLSADPITARRMLAAEQQRPRRGRRRIVARFNPPGSESFPDWLRRQGLEGMNRDEKDGM
jgi:hypothetical protein